MRVLLVVSLVVGSGAALGAEKARDTALPKPPPKSLVSGLKNPESVAVGTDGRIYVTEIGEFDKDGDGRVLVIQDGKAVPFATGLDDPKGLVAFQQWLFVADKKRVWRIDKSGKAEEYASEKAFPVPPLFLNDITVDEAGVLYVSDSGDRAGKRGAVYRFDAEKKATLVLDAEASSPPIPFPNGVLLDDSGHLLIADFSLGNLFRLDLKTEKLEKIGSGFGGTDGLAKDSSGRRFVGGCIGRRGGPSRAGAVGRSRDGRMERIVTQVQFRRKCPHSASIPPPLTLFSPGTRY